MGRWVSVLCTRHTYTRTHTHKHTHTQTQSTCKPILNRSSHINEDPPASPPTPLPPTPRPPPPPLPARKRWSRLPPGMCGVTMHAGLSSSTGFARSVHVCACVCARECACVRVRVRTYMHTRLPIHTYMHAHTHTCMNPMKTYTDTHDT